MMNIDSIKNAIKATYGSLENAITVYHNKPVMSAEDPDQDVPHPPDQGLHEALFVLVNDISYHIVVVGHCSITMKARSSGKSWIDVESFSDH